MNDQLSLAPLLAFTDSIFREQYFKHFSGVDRAIAPFVVVAENSRYKEGSLKALLPLLHEQVPVEPQILSKDGRSFAALALMLKDRGFTSVNLNLGCPAKVVINKGRGCAMLPQPQKIRDFLQLALPLMDMPISIKLRTGLYCHEEIFPVLEVLNDFPLSELIIHPRLGINKYEGEVDLSIMDKLLPMTNHKINYNGDLSRESFFAVKRRFPSISQWMIGREILKDPFLPEDIKSSLNREDLISMERSPLDENRLKIFRAFHNDLLHDYSKKYQKEVALVGKMKSFWPYWSSLFPKKEENLLSMGKILKLDIYRNYVDIIFKEKFL